MFGRRRPKLALPPRITSAAGLPAYRAADDTLVRPRLDELDGRTYEVLTPAAERLAGEYPGAASLRYRRPAESILVRDSSKQYGYAARDVRHSASLAGRVVDDGGIKGHGAVVAQRRWEHGRKYSFWQLLDVQ